MRTIALIGIAAGLAATAFAQTPPLKPGQYELSSQLSLAGRADKTPMQKLLHCYTPQDVANIATTLSGRSANQDCKLLSSKMVGSTLTYTSECSLGEEGRLLASGEVQFTSPDSYHAVVTMKQASGRGNAIVGGSTITTNAKRVGDCTK